MAEPTPVPTASAPSASLARRLRELRHSRFASTRLTQSEVAQALSEDEPVGVSALSAWENVRTPTLPSHRRLACYARLFATERSLTDSGVHLVPLADLTDGEDEARRNLERELFRLRDVDAGEPPPLPHESWRFGDGFPITIICSEIPTSDEVPHGPLSMVDNPNYTRLFSFADADALLELFGHLKASNPGASKKYWVVAPLASVQETCPAEPLVNVTWSELPLRSMEIN